MARTIKKIRIKNFKKFIDYTIEPNNDISIIIGDNEAGKSTILEAINLVTTATNKREQSVNLASIFNKTVIKDFLSGGGNHSTAPMLEIDLYLDGILSESYYGQNNLDKNEDYGIRLVCRLSNEYLTEFDESINSRSDYFPFEFYEIRFSTFADAPYYFSKDRLKIMTVDTTKFSISHINDDYASKLFHKHIEGRNEIIKLVNEYNKTTKKYCEENLDKLNDEIKTENENYEFALKENSVVDFENSLVLKEKGVCIENKGTGSQVLIKTELALNDSIENFDLVLIEEPENHLSDISLSKLISKISKSTNAQIFITTHNSNIVSRLKIKKCFILSDKDADKPMTLSLLDEDTEKYFIKCPSESLLRFVLSEKIILVEGPSEFILFDKFFEKVAGHSSDEDSVAIANINGLSFKRFLNVAKILNNKVAVVTDNDHSYKIHIIEKYKDYDGLENIKIFSSKDDNLHTFETNLIKFNDEIVSKYGDEETLVKNKTESAYKMLVDNFDLNVPDYIEEAIKWIRS